MYIPLVSNKQQGFIEMRGRPGISHPAKIKRRMIETQIAPQIFALATKNPV